MNICFIVDKPETSTHPVISRVLQHLSARHAVRLLDVRTQTVDEAIAQEQMQSLADLYFLKSHTLQACAVATHLEQRSALVINRPASALACLDRLLMARRLKEACLPGPVTVSLGRDLLGQKELVAGLGFPLVVKSRYSHVGDLVAKAHNFEDLQALIQNRKQGPFVLQRFVRGDGSDIRLSVIDQQVFAARGPSRLAVRAPRQDVPISATEVPNEWRSIALKICRGFGLYFYALDLLVTEQGAVVVDIDSFPGFRGVPGADSALVAAIERLGQARVFAVARENSPPCLWKLAS